MPSTRAPARRSAAVESGDRRCVQYRIDTGADGQGEWRSSLAIDAVDCRSSFNQQRCHRGRSLPRGHMEGCAVAWDAEVRIAVIKGIDGHAKIKELSNTIDVPGSSEFGQHGRPLGQQLADQVFNEGSAPASRNASMFSSALSRRRPGAWPCCSTATSDSDRRRARASI